MQKHVFIHYIFIYYKLMFIVLFTENYSVNKKKYKYNNIYLCLIAGWSRWKARWAHNPKVVGSNPIPATIVPEMRFELT